jgi:hypothetical protein
MIAIVWFYLAMYYAFNLGVTAMLYYDADFRSMSIKTQIVGVLISLFMALPVFIWSVFYINSEVKRRLDEMDK